MAQQYGNGGGVSVRLAGPFAGSGASAVKLTEITVLADAWKGATSPYSQVVAVEDMSMNSKVDLQLSVEQMEMFRDMVIAFSAVNVDGVVTVYAIGDKPDADHTIQATISEVIA